VRNDLSAVLIGASLVAAVWTVVLAARDRRASNQLLILLAGAELLTLVQLLLVVVQVIGGTRPDDTVTLLAYAVSALLILPIGVFWSQAERSRSSTLVIAVACLAVAVMTARMLQIWSTIDG
jgi:hypothetical protein